MGTFLKIAGIVAIVLGTLIWVAVLPMLARLLKKVNRSLADRARVVKEQVETSFSQLEDAQVQLESFAAATEAAKAGMKSTIRSADRALAFLKSGPFQVGLPIVLWFGLLVALIPRAIAATRYRRWFVPVDPPSWEEEEEE